MNGNIIILAIIILCVSYFALNEITDSINNVNSSAFVINDDREYNHTHYNLNLSCENCTDTFILKTGDNVTGTYNFSNTVFINPDGTINAIVYQGDGSYLIGVGEAAATALTMSARTTEDMAKGKCVYLSGATGTTADVSLCDNTHIDKHSMFGITAESKSIHQPILIRLRGELTSLDTSGYAENATLYMSTAGNFVTSAPNTGAIVMCGHVINTHISNGVIVVDDLLDHEIGAANNEDYTHRLGLNAKYIIKNSTNGIMAQWQDNGDFTALKGNYYFNNNITTPYIISDGSQLTGFVKKEIIAEGSFSGVAINITGLNLSVYRRIYMYVNFNNTINSAAWNHFKYQFNGDTNTNYNKVHLRVGMRAGTGNLLDYTAQVQQSHGSAGWTLPTSLYGEYLSSIFNIEFDPRIGHNRLLYVNTIFAQQNTDGSKYVYATGLFDLVWRNNIDDIIEMYLFWDIVLEGKYQLSGEY